MATDHAGWRQRLANRRALLERRQALEEAEMGVESPQRSQQADLDAAPEVHRTFVEAKWARQLAEEGTVERFDTDDCPCAGCAARAREAALLAREKIRRDRAQARRDAARGFAPRLEDWELP